MHNIIISVNKRRAGRRDWLAQAISVSRVSNAYLDENSAKIRSKPVPWEDYWRAELVTSEELVLIKKVGRQPRAKIESVLVSDGQIYALLYLRLLKKLQRVDTMQCLLVLIANWTTMSAYRYW